MNTSRLAPLRFDALMAELDEQFSIVTDKRAQERVQYSICDTLKSAFAMFSLKCPSLLNFRERTRIEDGNLQRVYRIGKIPGDTQMRATLDEVPPSASEYSFAEIFAHLHSSEILSDYRFEAAENSLIISVDGVEHFSSTAIHCPCCTVKSHRDGTTSSSHSALCAVVVAPGKSEVFPLDIEPILQHDGSEKNDCERNAAKRLLARLGERYASEALLFVEDALYANAPHIRQILEISPRWRYLLAVKPTSHKSLFARFDALKRHRPERFASHRYTDADGTEYLFEYANDMALSESASDVRVHILRCSVTPSKGKNKGKTTVFTYVTNINLRRSNVYGLMKAGRARWKIENETFNTLKNQGYHFEHNYGHGNKYLASLLASVMLLAFLVDQVQAAADVVFRKIVATLATKAKFWESLRAVFKTRSFRSMDDALYTIADLYKIQLE